MRRSYVPRCWRHSRGSSGRHQSGPSRVWSGGNVLRPRACGDRLRESNRPGPAGPVRPILSGYKVSPQPAQGRRAVPTSAGRAMGIRASADTTSTSSDCRHASRCRFAEVLRRRASGRGDAVSDWQFSNEFARGSKKRICPRRKGSRDAGAPTGLTEEFRPMARSTLVFRCSSSIGSNFGPPRRGIWGMSRTSQRQSPCLPHRAACCHVAHIRRYFSSIESTSRPTSATLGRSASASSRAAVRSWARERSCPVPGWMA
jgi:hypothetical protein